MAVLLPSEKYPPKSSSPDQQTVVIKQKILIPASRLDVYEALTDPKKHSAFTGARATGAPKSGESCTAWDGYIIGKYLDLIPGARIKQEWKTSEWPAGYAPSILEFKLKQKGSDTEISMIQREVPASQASSYDQGWVDHYWTPLKKYFTK